MSHDGKRPVTLEDLLRLKRAERPAPEFWEQFDRELRAKQLKALVRRRPWWRDLPRTFSGLTRYQLPLGAAAVLALTFVTVRDFSSESDEPQTPQRTTPAAPVAPASPAVAYAALQPAVQLPAASDSVAAMEAPVPERLSSAETVSMPQPAEHSAVMPLLVGALENESDELEASPSARYIAANLAAVHAADTMVAGAGLLGGAARSFETRSAAAARAAAIEPLQQMTPPSEVRLARYRSPLVATIADESADRSGERIARRLSGDRLYDHIGRIGARGDSVSWKF